MYKFSGTGYFYDRKMTKDVEIGTKLKFTQMKQMNKTKYYKSKKLYVGSFVWHAATQA